ncbi:hypothetical protein D3C72_887510 [compost metagenome]
MGVRGRCLSLWRRRRNRLRLHLPTGKRNGHTPTQPSPLAEGEGFCQRRPRPTASEPLIGIGRVLDPPQSTRPQKHPQPLAPLVQQGPQQHQPPPLRPDRRRRPFPHSPQGRAVRPHPVRLGHVIQRLGQQHDPRPRRPRRLGDQPMPRRPRPRRQPRPSLGSIPAQPSPVGPDRARRFAREPGPVRAHGVEIVIHRQGQQPPPPRPGPVRRQVQQGDRIAAARQGQHNGLSPFRGQPPIQPGEDPTGQAAGVVWRQLQLARVRSCVARVFCAAVAVSA